MESSQEDELKLSALKPFLKPQERLHKLPVPIVALTGGIATGKSTVAKAFQEKGCHVIDADSIVKKLYQKQDTKEFISRVVPIAISNEEIDFNILREEFFKNSKIKKSVEQFIYARIESEFVKKWEELGKPSWVIYDVPLLFEKNLSFLVDLIILVYAPESVQRQRMKERNQFSDEMISSILKSQWPIEEKKNASNLVIDNSKDRVQLLNEINKVFMKITNSEQTYE